MSLIKNVLLLIVSPSAGWDDIDRSGYSTAKVLSGLLYPLLALLSVSCFTEMLYDSLATLPTTLMKAIVAFTSYFVSYYAVVFILGAIFPKLIGGKATYARFCNYIAYNMAFLVIVEILVNVLQQLPPLNFFRLYVLLIAYKGLHFINVDKEQTKIFMFICGALLLLLPCGLALALNFIIVR